MPLIRPKKLKAGEVPERYHPPTPPIPHTVRDGAHRPCLQRQETLSSPHPTSPIARKNDLKNVKTCGVVPGPAIKN